MLDFAFSPPERALRALFEQYRAIITDELFSLEYDRVVDTYPDPLAPERELGRLVNAGYAEIALVETCKSDALGYIFRKFKHRLPTVETPLRELSTLTTFEPGGEVDLSHIAVLAAAATSTMKELRQLIGKTTPLFVKLQRHFELTVRADEPHKAAKFKDAYYLREPRAVIDLLRGAHYRALVQLRDRLFDNVTPELLEEYVVTAGEIYVTDPLRLAIEPMIGHESEYEHELEEYRVLSDELQVRALLGDLL
jgi:hypothetical protein